MALINFLFLWVSTWWRQYDVPFIICTCCELALFQAIIIIIVIIVWWWHKNDYQTTYQIHPKWETFLILCFIIQEERELCWVDAIIKNGIWFVNVLGIHLHLHTYLDFFQFWILSCFILTMFNRIKLFDQFIHCWTIEYFVTLKVIVLWHGTWVPSDN